MQSTRGRGDTSALIASETTHPSSSELSEPFPTKSAYSKQARIYFRVFFALACQLKPAPTFHLNWETLCAGSPPEQFLVGVWIHPHQSPGALILSLLPCCCWGWQDLALRQADRRLHSLLALGNLTTEVTCKLGSTSLSTKAGSQLRSYHWNTPNRLRPQRLLSGRLSPPRQWRPHQTPSASNPRCWKETAFSSQLTSDMCLTRLSFQNSEAKPSANTASAGPATASLIETCLLQNVWTWRAGCRAGSGAGRAGKFRWRQKTNQSRRRTERG